MILESFFPVMILHSAFFYWNRLYVCLCLWRRTHVHVFLSVCVFGFLCVCSVRVVAATVVLR
jgi:hypothetical protein